MGRYRQHLSKKVIYVKKTYKKNLTSLKEVWQENSFA